MFRVTSGARAAAAVAVVAGLVGAGASSSAAQDTIKIGVITDNTGTAKFYAEPVTQGTILAAKVLNSHGGVLGKKIELLIEDDSNKPDVSASKAQKLIDEGVVAILSNSSSTATQQAQNTTIKTLTPQVTPSNSSDQLTTVLDHKCFFQLGPLGSTQIATLMSYTRAKRFKRVALMTDNSALGQVLAKYFKKGLEASGASVVAEEVVPGGSKSAVPQVQKVRAANPEAIFQAGILGREMVLFFRAYHQLGLKQPILGSFNLSIPTYLRTAKDMMEGVAFVDAFDPAKPEAAKFIDEYKKEYGKTPFSLPGYGYDGMMFIADALKRAGSTDKAKVCAAMQATTGLAGAMGAKGSAYGFPPGKRTGFDPQGAVVRLIKANQHGPVVHSGTK